MTSMQEYIEKLRQRKAIARGTAQDADAQHKKGRLTARERIDLLFDPGTFEEIDTLVLPRYEVYPGGKRSRYGDGVVTGFGLINGRRAFVAAQDASVMGGSLGEMHANKIVKAMHMALKYGCPFIAINDSAAHAFRKGSIAWADMRASSMRTVKLQGSSRNSRSLWDHAPVARSIHRR